MATYSPVMSDRAPVDGRSSYLSAPGSVRTPVSMPPRDNGGVRGGVGLVFRKDEGPTPSSFLIVAEVLSEGPAAKSGMIRAGDRLRKIDGVELGSAPEEESPQLPGPHGSPVTLTLERPSRGSFFDPTVGILSYNIKLTRSSNFFPDKLQSTAEVRNAELERKEREARYEARYGAGGAGWYSSGYEKLALMAASMSNSPGEAPESADASRASSRARGFDNPMASLPPMVDTAAFVRQPDISDLDGDGLIGQAEEKLAKDEVEGLKKYVKILQQELADKKMSEMKLRALEEDLKQEQLHREKLELQLTKDNLREKQMQDEIDALRNEDREVDLKVLVRGKMDQLVREKEILLADLRHQQVQHRSETQALEERIAQLMREKDEIRLDMRIEADNERKQQQERYQEYHAKTTGAMKAMAQDLADAVKEKEEAKAALSKFRVGDGVFWEEENRSLKDKGADLRGQLAEEREQRELAQRKADQLAKEVLRLRAELKREGRPVDHLMTLESSPAPPDSASLTPRLGESPPLKQVRTPPASADNSMLRAAPPPPPPVAASPDRSVDRGVGAGVDKTEEIMSLYLNGQEKTVVRDVPPPASRPGADREEEMEDEGPEGPFPLGPRSHVIEVVVAKARQLPPVEQPQECANYMVVSFKGSPIGTTEQKRGVLPAWHETFKETTADKATGLVSIVLYQNQGEGGEKNKCIGYIAVPLERVIRTGNEEGWYDLLDQDNQPVQGAGGSAEALVRVSCKQNDEQLQAMSGWVRCQLPGSAKDAPVHRFVWQLDPYAGVIKSSKGMASATEIGDEEFRLSLKAWEVVEDQTAVRSIAGKVQNGVDGFCFVLAKKEERETLLVEVSSERKRSYWVAALQANTSRSVDGGTERVIEQRDVAADTPIHVMQPKAVVDIWVLGSRNFPPEAGKSLACELQVGHQHRTITAQEAITSNVTWNESVQIGVQDVKEPILVKVRELGVTGATVGVVKLGPAEDAASGDGWVGTDGWVPLEEVAAVQDEQSPAEVRLHVALRPVGEVLAAEVGRVGWMEKADAVEPRQVFAVLDPYSQDLRLYPDREGAVLGEAGRLDGRARKEPLSQHGVRSAEVTRLDTVPSHDGSVLMLVEPTEGESGQPARLVASSEDDYVKWKNALNRVARNPTKKRMVPKAAPPPAKAAPVEEAPPPPQAAPPPPSPPDIVPAEAPAHKLPAPVGLFEVPLKMPKALLEVFVFRAQDLPLGAEAEAAAGAATTKTVWGVVRAGDETCTTLRLDTTTGAVLWDEVFQLGARGEASDLVTVILWAASPPSDPVCVGHIAVPISRVAATGQEEGWYEVRDRTGQIVKGAKGASMIRAGITHRQVPKELSRGRARIAGWLVMVCADAEGGEPRARKVVGLVNPYSEQLQVFETENDAREGKNVVATTNLPGSHAEAASSFSSELTAVVAAERREGVWEEGFVLTRKDTTVHCIVEESSHVKAWLEALKIAGNGAAERREARKRAKQAAEASTPSSAKNEQMKAEGEVVEVVVERARNLQGAYQKGAVKGFLCSVQMQDQKHATSLSQQEDTPIWKERFPLSVVDSTADLATVMLHVQAESGGSPECVGHIAVPVSRIAKKGKEEGWYDVTSAASTTGELLAGSGGKAGLLVSFRYKNRKE